MGVTVPDVSRPDRSSWWKWQICGLLLLATMLNYMDRLTLNQTGVRIKTELHLDAVDYGHLESGFAFAFALGGLIFGWMADRWSVRWIYPAAILGWSTAGFATGLAPDFLGLLVCRFCLGLAEAGNWPCALRTTQHILPPSERPMGNSLLQSGAAFGAIATPFLVMALVDAPGTWRYPFLVVGALGVLWVVLWARQVREEDLAKPAAKPAPTILIILALLVCLLGLDLAVHLLAPKDSVAPLAVKVGVTVFGIFAVFLWLWHVTRDDTAIPRRVFVRRYWVLATLVVTLNATWHFFRAWTPLFLQEAQGYSESAVQWFTIAYYAISDVGCLTVGFVTLWLARGGLSVHWSRVLVFGTCAAVTTLSVAVAFLPAGPLLLASLLVIGFAALGLFPNYYSFSQEITVQYQGKVTGALGCTCWLSMSLLHEVVGDSVKRTGSYSQAMAAAGLVPLIGLAALVLFWGKSQSGAAPVEEPEALARVSAEPIDSNIQAVDTGIQTVSEKAPA
jgi:ACS family hexuronate transporter-like MFS transporter